MLNKPRRLVANYLTSAWRVSLFAMVSSGLITGVVMLAVFGTSASIPFGLLMSTIASGPLSYYIARVIFNIRTQLERQNAELLSANAELDAFASTVAHDLKNPVNNILGYTDFLSNFRDTMSPDEFSKSLDRIATAGKHMAVIIDELLLLAHVRSEEIQKSRVDMASLVEQVKLQLEPLIEESNAKIEVKNDLPPASGYAPWILEVWMNYLTNGIKYGGTPPRIEIGAETKNGRVRYWVKDNGPGISVDEKNHLFTEFIRLEKNRDKADGTGLGLSIVQRIVDKLDGEVGVDSTVGQGSTFYFILPGA